MSTAAPNEQLITITVNDTDIQVPRGELIVESVKKLGLEIPIFCYHPRMKPVGMCRMCLVEIGFKQSDGTVRMMPKPQAGCTLPAMENLVVLTDTESIRKDRKGVLELLLINHPLDCPVCDRGGECPLQNNTLFYGPSTSRYIEDKRHLPKAFPLSRYVTLDLERCIQCGRCVRFTEEVSGDAQLAFLFRGAAMTPRTFAMTDFDSKFSGNVIEICPVGALTSTDYRFRARPWDLETRPSVCLECGSGCNVWFDYRAGKMVRINGRENNRVNEEWTCDKGKFGHDYLNSNDRLSEVLVRDGESFRPGEWSEAYGEIIRRFQAVESCAGLVGSKCSNEDLFLFRRMFAEHFGSDNFDHRWTRELPRTGDSGLDEVHSSLQELESVSAALVFGNDLAEELPMAYLRLRKAWMNQDAKIVVASDSPTYTDRIAYASLRYKPGTGLALLGGLTRAVLEKRGVQSELSMMVAGLTPEVTETLTGVSQAAIDRAAGALVGAFTTVCTRAIYNQENGAHLRDALANLAMAAESGGSFNCYACGANDEGAASIGILPQQNGKNTGQILASCANGSIKALWLVECDPFELWNDKELVHQALENVEFLVVQASSKNRAWGYASVVLPCCAHSETDGSYTNAERRVQKIARIVPPMGQAKPSWKVFSEVIVRMQPQAPAFSAREVLSELIRQGGVWSGFDVASLSGEGGLLPVGNDTNPGLIEVSYLGAKV